MKVIVSAVALLATLPAAQSAPEEKKIIFLSLDQKPSEWLSDKPVSLYVDPFGKPYESEGSVITRDKHRPNSWPILDLPGPGYHGKKGAFPWLEELP